MDRYYKMCIAAGLNYYRKVPNLVDLQKISGLSIPEFFINFRTYEFSSQLVHKLMGEPDDSTVEENALRMVMKEKGNFIWTGEKWITKSEGRELVKDTNLDELMSLFKGVKI